MYSIKDPRIQINGIVFVLFAALTTALHGQDEDNCIPSREGNVVLYCNLNDTALNPSTGNLSRKIAPFPGDRGAAQKFTAGEVGNVSSVTLGLNRVGSPGGRMIFTIREVDEATGHPGETIGTLGEIENDALPRHVWGGKELLEVVTIDGLVEGLVTGNEYFLHFVHTPDTNFTGNGGGPTNAWVVDLVDEPNDAEPSLVEWADPPQFPEPVWSAYTNDAVTRIRLRIEGTASDVSPTDPFLIAMTEDGSVTKVPDLDKYPIGSEVSVTASPEDGFLFVKWTYGDEEFTSNPAIITIAEGATLIPIFAKLLNIDIAHAVAVTWDSQSGKTYQIHSSTDMETWELAIDAVEGTGERLTHCFIREDSEIYYRVEDSP